MKSANYTTLQAFQREWCSSPLGTSLYVEHYNNARMNSAIGYITPKDMLAGHQQEIHADRDRKLEAAREQRSEGPDHRSVGSERGQHQGAFTESRSINAPSHLSLSALMQF